MKRLMLLLMAALLASCGSPAVFERPVMEMPEGTARTSPVGAGWWHIFNDRALDRLEEKAVAHNRDLVRASALVDQASALAAQTGAAMLPRAELEAGASSEELSEGERYMNNLPDRARDLWSMSGVLSYEVDLWGKLRARTEAARAELLASSAASHEGTGALNYSFPGYVVSSVIFALCIASLWSVRLPSLPASP